MRSTTVVPSDGQDLLVGGQKRGRRAIGIGLLALWATWALAAVWCGPWSTSPDRLAADARGGVVREWTTTDHSLPDPLAEQLYGGDSPRGYTRVSSEHDTAVWRDARGRTWWTVVDGDVPGIDLPDPPAGEGAPSGATKLDAERLRTWLRARAGAHTQHPAAADPAAPLTALHSALAVATIVAIVWGPVPRRGNRWYWFWVGGLTAGLGTVWLAVAEYLRPPATARVSRSGGWAGLFTAVVASFVLDLVLSLLWAAARP